jgi:hypothetical protein
MAVVTIELREETFPGLGDTPEGFVREMRLAAAIFWYARGVIRVSTAASIEGRNGTSWWSLRPGPCHWWG